MEIASCHLTLLQRTKNVVLTAIYVPARFKLGASLSLALPSQNISKAAPHYATEPSALRLSLWAGLRARGGSRVMLLATFFLAKEAVLAKETADGGCNPKMRPHCLAEAFHCLLVCRV